MTVPLGYGDGDAASFGRVLDGIVQEIHHHLLEAGRISLYFNRISSITSHGNTLLLGEKPHLLSRCAGKLCEIQTHGLYSCFASFQSGDRQEAFDDFWQSLGFLESTSDGVSHLPR